MVINSYIFLKDCVKTLGAKEDEFWNVEENKVKQEENEEVAQEENEEVKNEKHEEITQEEHIDFESKKKRKLVSSQPLQELKLK